MDFEKYLTNSIGFITAKSIKQLPYDKKCPIPRGARVEKFREAEPGKELHPIGSRGYTVGGFMNFGIDCYLVKWDIQINIKVPGTDGTVVAVMGWKIKQINNKTT